MTFEIFHIFKVFTKTPRLLKTFLKTFGRCNEFNAGRALYEPLPKSQFFNKAFLRNLFDFDK